MVALALRAYVAIVGRLGEARRGATAVEYGLLIALVAAVCISAITLLSKGNSGLYATMYSIVRAMTSP